MEVSALPVGGILPQWAGAQWPLGGVRCHEGCKSMLVGTSRCSPFEEGILHLWRGGLVAIGMPF